jgi:hypothetical protein
MMESMILTIYGMPTLGVPVCDLLDTISTVCNGIVKKLLVFSSLDNISALWIMAEEFTISNAVKDILLFVNVIGIRTEIGFGTLTARIFFRSARKDGIDCSCR